MMGINRNDENVNGETELDNFESKSNLFGMVCGSEVDISDYETFNLNELDVGNSFQGKPTLMVFEKEADRNYRTILLKLVDESAEQCVNLYMNAPDFKGDLIKKVKRSSKFFRPLFDFIFSLNKYINPSSIMGDDGEEINIIEVINIALVKLFVDDKENIGILVSKGADENYNSFKVIKIE